MFHFGYFMVMLQSCVDNFRDLIIQAAQTCVWEWNFDMLIKYQGPVH